MTLVELDWFRRLSVEIYSFVLSKPLSILKVSLKMKIYSACHYQMTISVRVLNAALSSMQISDSTQPSEEEGG